MLLVYLFVTYHMTGVCLFVCGVGPGFDSTSPAFMRSRASQAAGSDGRLAQKRNMTPISGGRVCVDTLFTFIHWSMLGVVVVYPQIRKIIQPCLRLVVGPGFVSTCPAFMRSGVNHPAGPHGRIVKNCKSGLQLLGVGVLKGFTVNFIQMHK